MYGHLNVKCFHFTPLSVVSHVRAALSLLLTRCQLNKETRSSAQSSDARLPALLSGQRQYRKLQNSKQDAFFRIKRGSIWKQLNSNTKNQNSVTYFCAPLSVPIVATTRSFQT